MVRSWQKRGSCIRNVIFLSYKIYRKIGQSEISDFVEISGDAIVKNKKKPQKKNIIFLKIQKTKAF